MSSLPRLHLTGQRFGRLTVLAECPDRYIRPNGKHASRRWHCLCDCGNSVTVVTSSLRGGGTQSCGCLHRERSSEWERKKGGLRRTREYASWTGLIRRCTNPEDRQYPDYGGRGITVCAHWLVFLNFLADMGKRPAGKSIDRKDNNGGYWCGHCPECLANQRPANCRWATQKEQNNNQRHRQPVVFRDERLPLSTWAERLGKPLHLLSQRLRNGWSIEAAFTMSSAEARRRPKRLGPP